VPASSDTDSSPDVFTDFFTTPGLETRSYLNDPAMADVQVVREYDASGNVVASYTYGTERISDTASDETSEYLYDGRGSVSQTYEGTSPTNALTYDAFGTPAEGIDGPEALFAWNAEDYDPQTGLIYLRARYYASDLASFISQDSRLGSITDTDSTNRYTYAEGDPVNNQDPSGHTIGNTSYERQMEAAGGINEIYNFYVGQSLANSYNQATVAFNARLGYAQGVSYTSLSAINSIAYISQTEANAYINQGAARALSIGAAYGCSPGSLTMAAVNQFAADVATAKDTTNTRIANVQANKVALYTQYQVWLAEQAWLAAQAEHAALKMGAKGSVGKSVGTHSIGSYRAPMPQVTVGKISLRTPTTPSEKVPFSAQAFALALTPLSGLFSSQVAKVASLGAAVSYLASPSRVESEVAKHQQWRDLVNGMYGRDGITFNAETADIFWMQNQEDALKRLSVYSEENWARYSPQMQELLLNRLMNDASLIQGTTIGGPMVSTSVSAFNNSYGTSFSANTAGAYHNDIVYIFDTYRDSNGKYDYLYLPVVIHEVFHDYQAEVALGAYVGNAIVMPATRNAWYESYTDVTGVAYGADAVEFYAYMFEKDYYSLGGHLQYDATTGTFGNPPIYTGIWTDYSREIANAYR
jgi:RHS repeat-associated protein